MQEKSDVMIELLKGIDFKLSLILGKMIKTKDGGIVIKDEIRELFQFGADSKTIAQILGIPTDHASQEISRLKKLPMKKQIGIQKSKKEKSYG